MKHITAVFLIISLLCAAVLSGCSDKNTDADKEKVKTTQASPSDSSAANEGDSAQVLGDYFASFTEGDNPLYGTWQLKDFEYISFIFRNDKLAEMAMGTEGDFASLSLDKKKKTLGVTFMLGLNGVYNYSLSKDEKTLTLTLNGEEKILTKQDDYNFIPDPPKKPKIDRNILGWWKNKDGIVYYFGKDGIMYSNHISLETCYTYSADDGKIKAVYDYGGDVNTELEYSYKNGVLKIEGDKYLPYKIKSEE